MKLKAGILPLALSICLIMAALCSALLLLSYYHNISQVDYRIRQQLKHNVESGIAYCLATPKGSSTEILQDWGLIQLFENQEDSIFIKRSLWGIFELAQVKAIKGRWTESRTAFLGVLPDAMPALYISDQQRPIQIAGDAKITGDAFLPEAGIRAGYINRQGYGKSQLIFGEVKKSSPTLPALNTKANDLEGWLRNAVTSATIEEISADTFFTFSANEYQVHTSNKLVRVYQALRGQLIIYSTKEVIVEPEAKLEKIIIYAPKITIKRGFIGNLQVFASDTLFIEDNVELLYPSAAGIITNQGSSLIEIGKGTHIAGHVFSIGQQAFNNQAIVKISSEADISGSVYANGFVELSGEIKGSLSASKLLVQTSSATYENFLFNGKIDRNKLPDAFAFSSVFYSGKRTIVEWLQ